jgi:hypothetical protein
VAADVVTNEEKRSVDGVTFLIPLPTRLHRQLGLVPNTEIRLFAEYHRVDGSGVGSRRRPAKMVVLLGQWGCSGANRLIAQKGSSPSLSFFYIFGLTFFFEGGACGWEQETGVGGFFEAAFMIRATDDAPVMVTTCVSSNRKPVCSPPRGRPKCN